jgi:enamine deaminase RidA (YjgF/YER057c/UK114 family)
MDFDQRLEELFIDLPEPPQERGKGVNAVRTGKLLYVGGVLPRSEGRMMAGRAGVEVRLDMATSAARAATMFALAIIKSELGGSLNKVKRIVQVSSLVACGTDFKDHLRVLDGASDLLIQIFGSSGKHTRISAGVMSLPENATVELSMIVEIK